MKEEEEETQRVGTETFLAFLLAAITQLNPSSIPKLVIRRCVFGEDTLFIGSEQIFHCF